MKHTLKRTTYILFSVITPIIFCLLYKFGRVSLKFFAFSGICFELLILFMFLVDYDLFPKHFKK